jgi:multidrug efflux pump subunit AcrA (membrane-fusion protein)
MHRIPSAGRFFCIIAMIATAAIPVFFSCDKKPAIGTDQSAQEIVYHCPMHPDYMSHTPGNCPICGMKLVSVKSTAQDKNGTVPPYQEHDSNNAVRIDPAIVQNSGVRTEKAAIRNLTMTVRTSANVVPDERRIKIITTKIRGYVEELHVNYTGQRILKGQPLYDIYSPDLVSAQSEYIQAYRNAVNEDSGKLLQSARQRLLNWDVTEEQIMALEKLGTAQKNMTVVSPASGIVAEKAIVEGQNVEPGMQLYKIIDYSRVWVEGAIYQQDVQFVKTGQKGTVELDYYPGRRFEGTVSYIAPELDIESRTLKVRLDIVNTPDYRIRPGMNASLTLYIPATQGAVAVPDQAIIRSGLRNIAVIAKGNGYFEPREVKTGRSAGGYTEITHGIMEGEDIVVSSQFLIDAESNLRTAVAKMSSGAAQADTLQYSENVMKNMHENKENVKTHETNNAAGKVYTCPMHPEVTSSSPGLCPKCNMKLVLKKDGF